MDKNNGAGLHRVVITGTGVITPVGNNVPDTWAAILAGKSGLGDFTFTDRGRTCLRRGLRDKGF